MFNDPLFQAKLKDVDYVEWLTLKWLGSRNDAVVKRDAAIFAAASQDAREIAGVTG
jgi:hypothetical protein